MKKDKLYIEDKTRQIVYYVENDDEKFIPIVSGSYLAHNLLDKFFERRKKLEESLRKELLNNKISPIYYYFIMFDMGEADLTSRVNITKRKLRKHFKPEHFKKIKLEILLRYADVFDIPVSSFFFISVVKESGRNLELLRTNNPFFTVIRCNSDE